MSEVTPDGLFVDQCPERGPGLTHARPTGSESIRCAHCGANPNAPWPDDISEVGTVNPIPMYEAQQVIHIRDRIVASKSKRPILASKHDQAVNILERAILIEEWDQNFNDSVIG